MFLNISSDLAEEYRNNNYKLFITNPEFFHELSKNNNTDMDIFNIPPITMKEQLIYASEKLTQKYNEETEPIKEREYREKTGISNFLKKLLSTSENKSKIETPDKNNITESEMEKFFDG